LPQEQPPIENEGGAFVPVPPSLIPRALSSLGSVGEMADTARPITSVLESESRQPPSPGLRALRSIVAILPGIESLQLLRYEPVRDGQEARFIETAAIRKEQGYWIALDLPDQELYPALAALADSVTLQSATLPAEAVLHLPGMLAALCRNYRGELQGALLARPDTFGTGAGTKPPPDLIGLLTTQALFALELENSALEIRRLTEIVAEEVGARESFISFAAHELRSPLTSVKGYAQLLVRQARKTPLPDTMMRSIQSIEQQSVRMSEMLGEMLDASRILHGKLEMIPTDMDLAALVNKVVERRRLFFPEHNLIVLGVDAPIRGYWDSGRVEQILRDLVDNAARHSPNGSTVVVEVTNDLQGVTVGVRDQGVGIAAADQDHIFEYLYRSKDSERRNLSGLGLGLFVSQHLAERLGGRLWLHTSTTTPPSGSEFRFTLPRTLPR
jgi:signal transduction histidine kinase